MRSSTRIFDPRQNMKRSDYEVFHYRDSKTCEVEVHHHDFYEIYFFLGGKASYWIEGTSYPMEVGDLLFIGPSELHRPVVEETSVYERIVLWIDKKYLNTLSTPEVNLARLFDREAEGHVNFLRPDTTKRDEIRRILDKLVEEYYGCEFGSAVYAEGLLRLFLTEVNRLTLNETVTREEEGNLPLVQRVLAYITENYWRDLSLEGLAEEFSISKYHLSHAFSREVGVGVYRYIKLKRLLTARQMIADGVSAGVASRACGFKDYANFYRAFRAEYGVSPGESGRPKRKSKAE